MDAVRQSVAETSYASTSVRGLVFCQNNRARMRGDVVFAWPHDERSAHVCVCLAAPCNQTGFQVHGQPQVTQRRGFTPAMDASPGNVRPSVEQRAAAVADQATFGASSGAMSSQDALGAAAAERDAVAGFLDKLEGLDL